MKGLRFEYIDESKPIPNEPVDVHADEYWDSVNQELQGLTHGKRNVDFGCYRKAWITQEDIRSQERGEDFIC